MNLSKKEVTSAFALTGLQFVTLSPSATDPSLLKPQVHKVSKSLSHQVSATEARSLEASHLEIYAACKWGKASFAPQQDDSFPYLSDIGQIYEAMDHV